VCVRLSGDPLASRVCLYIACLYIQWCFVDLIHTVLLRGHDERLSSFHSPPAPPHPSIAVGCALPVLGWRTIVFLVKAGGGPLCWCWPGSCYIIFASRSCLLFWKISPFVGLFGSCVRLGVRGVWWRWWWFFCVVFYDAKRNVGGRRGGVEVLPRTN